MAGGEGQAEGARRNAPPPRRARGTWGRRAAAIGLGAIAILALARDGLRGPRPAPRLVSAGWSTRVALPPAAAQPAPSPKEPEEPFFPFLLDEPTTESVSVGDTSDGFVVNARPLVDDETVATLPSHRARNLNYGTRELVDLLRRVGGTLHERTQTRLWVGNIGRRGGGDVSYSVSHNSGRDVDLAICYRDAKGRPVDPPELVPLNSVGISKDGRLFFDPGRTWIVVRALLESEAPQVKYVFFYNALRKLMLEHAASHGEPPSMIERAAAVVVQPAGAAHNDHLHVRIACSERDVLGGCLTTGVEHAWVKTHERARRAFVERLRGALGDPRPLERQRAIERLVLLRATDAASSVAARMADDVPEVRAAAAAALGVLGGEDAAGSIAARYSVERSFAVRVAMLGALRAIGGESTTGFLSKAIEQPATAWAESWSRATGPVLAWHDTSATPALVAATALRLFVTAPKLAAPRPAEVDWHPGDPDPPDGATQRWALRLVAIDAAGDSGDMAAADALFEALADSSPVVRGRAAAALARLTNTLVGGGWADPAAPSAVRAKLIARWRAWVERRRGLPRDGLLAAGFVAAGYKIPEIHPKHLWELVRAVGGQDHHHFNALAVLRRLTSHAPAATDRTPAQSCAHWLRWLRNRRGRFGLDPPPPILVKRCGR